MDHEDLGDIEAGEKFLQIRAARDLGNVGEWRELYADKPSLSVASSEDITNVAWIFVSPFSRFVSGAVLTIEGVMAVSQAVVGAK
ncbi:MAG: hypothetical protein ACJAXK_000628 [Yoonia sp.]